MRGRGSDVTWLTSRHDLVTFALINSIYIQGRRREHRDQVRVHRCMSTSYVERRAGATARQRALRRAIHARSGRTGPRPAVVGAPAPVRRGGPKSSRPGPPVSLDAVDRAERQWTWSHPGRRAATPPDDRDGLTIRVAWDVVDGPGATAVEALQTEALAQLLRWMVAGAGGTDDPRHDERLDDDR